MKKIALVFFIFFSTILIAQNNTIRISFPYLMPVSVFSDHTPFAFGITAGVDVGLSEQELIKINYKPRVFIIDGDAEAKEHRFILNYKRFLKNNFFVSSGISLNKYDYISYGPYAKDIDEILFTIGPNVVFGKRYMLNNHLFTDMGLGFSLNFKAYNKSIFYTLPDNVDYDTANQSDYIAIIHDEPYTDYPLFLHIFVFQFGYLFR